MERQWLPWITQRWVLFHTAEQQKRVNTTLRSRLPETDEICRMSDSTIRVINKSVLVGYSMPVIMAIIPINFSLAISIVLSLIWDVCDRTPQQQAGQKRRFQSEDLALFSSICDQGTKTPFHRFLEAFLCTLLCKDLLGKPEMVSWCPDGKVGHLRPPRRVPWPIAACSAALLSTSSFHLIRDQT